MVDAPPASAHDISAPVAVSVAFRRHFPTVWINAAHPLPRRQISLFLELRVECQTSTGETRAFGSGDRLLVGGRDRQAARTAPA